MNFIQSKVEQGLRIDIERLRQEFLSKKHQFLADAEGLNCDNKDDFYAFLINLLFHYGYDVECLLDYVNEYSGLWHFQVLPDRDDYEQMGARESCAPFIQSLSRENQEFVFMAISAENFLFPDSQMIHLLETGNADQPEELFNTKQFHLEALYSMLEVSAKHHLDGYLLEYPEPTTRLDNGHQVPAEANSIKEELLGQIQGLREDLFDSVDSLKAGQMEILHERQRNKERAVDYEPFLQECLGDLYNRLQKESQRFLQFAEYHFNHTNDPDGYSHTLLYFVSTFETELKTRVILPLVDDLIAQGYSNYISQEGGFFPLVKEGKLNERLTLGQRLRYLRKDKKVRDIVEKKGFDIDTLLRYSHPLIKARNPNVHSHLGTIKEAEGVREMLLGPRSVVRLLFPSRRSECVT